MTALVLDTHSVVWYLLDSPMLSATALGAIESAVRDGDLIYVPSISIVEVAYLVEKDRLPEAAFERLCSALDDPGSSMRVAPLDLSVARSMRRIARDAVPDMPDRIIAATALHLGVPLVTRDVRIQSSSVATIW